MASILSRLFIDCRGFRPPPDRNSVLAYPDPRFADTITAQFAALRLRLEPRASWQTSLADAKDAQFRSCRAHRFEDVAFQNAATYSAGS